MADTILKTKILEKYNSIRFFCSVNDLEQSTINPYCNGKRHINKISLITLNKVCDALDCSPSDIGYTKEYWYKVCSKTKSVIVEPPSFIKEKNSKQESIRI